MRFRFYGGGLMAFAVAILTALAITAIPEVRTSVDLASQALAIPDLGAPLTAITFLAIGHVATRDLKTILKELKETQEKWRGKPMPQNEGEKFEALAAEAKALQDEADRDKQVKKFEAFSREVPDPALPAGGEEKSNGNGRHLSLLGEHSHAGYMSLGAAVVASPEFQAFAKAGAPKGQMAIVSLDTAEIGQKGARRIVVPMSQKQFADLRARIESKAIEGKAVPTLAAGVIVADRIAEVVRTTEQDRLRLRDVINVSTTGSNAVEYVVITSYTRAATEVAEAGSKPEAAMAVGTATAPVRTIAVHMPVTNQQLEDIPQIQNMVDVELRYDLDKEEEEQIMYGSGAGQELQGILPLAGVPLITRTVTATQNLDRIRIGITDVLMAGGEPNAVAIHPIDWEAIVLLKGTDNRYVWTIVTDARGEPRVFGVQPVETVAMKNPANLQRYLLVGDFIRGATLWDRRQTQVTVGMINAQFIQNLRTILAERRVAFGIKRPKFFAKFETATAV